MSQFIYLLNAMEDAAQASDPSTHGYGLKRQAVLDYVAKLETPRPEVGRDEWVSVSDRRPDARATVLCYSSYGVCKTLTGMELSNQLQSADRPWTHWTHWMPLPDAPLSPLAAFPKEEQ